MKKKVDSELLDICRDLQEMFFKNAGHSVHTQPLTLLSPTQ